MTLLSLSALLLAACQAEYPLDPAPQVTIDLGLVGSWHCLLNESDSADAAPPTDIQRGSSG